MSAVLSKQNKVATILNKQSQPEVEHYYLLTNTALSAGASSSP